MESATFEQKSAGATPESLSENRPAVVLRDSAVLRRLMEEVRNQDVTRSSVATAYDRAHNRHNR